MRYGNLKPANSAEGSQTLARESAPKNVLVHNYKGFPLNTKGTDDISLKLVKFSFHSYFVLPNTSVEVRVNPLCFVLIH